MYRFDLINRLFLQELFKSRRMKEEEPKRDEPETEERSAAKKVGGSVAQDPAGDSASPFLHLQHPNPGKDFPPNKKELLIRVFPVLLVNFIILVAFFVQLYFVVFL